MADPAKITRAHRDAKGRMLPGNPGAWQPGEHGGGRGRPSSEREVTEAARSLAVEGLQTLAEVMRDHRAQAVARVRAVEILLERGYGKAPQRVLVEADVASLGNPALAAFIRQTMEEMAKTIEGEAETIGSGDHG